MVYYFCHCVSLHVCPSDFFILALFLFFFFFFLERNCPFGFACSLLIVAPFL